MALLRYLSVRAILLALVLNVILAHGAATAGPGSLIFARQNPGCITGCPALPACQCNDNQRCELTAQTCGACAEVKCVDIVRPQEKFSGGAIAGACLGGLVGATVFSFVVWKLCGKKRKRSSFGASAAEKENDFGMLKSARASTHTVASIASTVRTRASNVIQIAYIPGVTNRSNPNSPSHLVPPVPPITYADSPTGSQFPRTPHIDIQFAADDLVRNSVYTVDNRSSIATTIYGGNAIVHTVQQPTMIRAGRAAVVTVKAGSVATNSSDNSPTPGSRDSIPPVPALFTTAGPAIAQRKPTTIVTTATESTTAAPPSPTFSIGANFLNSVNTKEADAAANQKKSEPIPQNTSTQFDSDSDSDDENDELVPGHRGERNSVAESCITAMDPCSPFSDDNIAETLPAVAMIREEPKQEEDLNKKEAVEAAKRRSRQLEAEKRESRVIMMARQIERTNSPFDDSNAIDKSSR
ncbi:hypothetical protein BZA77DRAFT_145600 [Pyronema omphalodes]|nr:hypothetical protein BZA77DRAFT_145600 [Pyronema omphalodes]